MHVSKLYSFKSEQFDHRPAAKLLDVIFSVYAAFVHLSKLYSLRKAPHPSAFKVNNNFKCVGLAVHPLGHTKCSFIKLPGTYNYFEKFWDLNLKLNKKSKDFMQSCFPFFVYFKCCRDFLLYFYKCSTSMAFT